MFIQQSRVTALLLFSLGQASVQSIFPICAEAKVEKAGNIQISQCALMRWWWKGGCTRSTDEEWRTEYVPWSHLLRVVKQTKGYLFSAAPQSEQNLLHEHQAQLKEKQKRSRHTDTVIDAIKRWREALRSSWGRPVGIQGITKQFSRDDGETGRCEIC